MYYLYIVFLTVLFEILKVRAVVILVRIIDGYVYNYTIVYIIITMNSVMLLVCFPSHRDVPES